MCNDSAPQFYAVDCSKNFKGELLVLVYDLDSGFALDAEMACHK